MTDLTTRARELCEGSVDPRIVRTVYELCEALENANKEIERLHDLLAERNVLLDNQDTELAQLREAQNNPCQNCQSGDPDQCGLDCMEAKKNK